MQRPRLTPMNSSKITRSCSWRQSQRSTLCSKSFTWKALIWMQTQVCVQFFKVTFRTAAAVESTLGDRAVSCCLAIYEKWSRNISQSLLRARSGEGSRRSLIVRRSRTGRRHRQQSRAVARSLVRRAQMTPMTQLTFPQEVLHCVRRR